MEKFRHFAFLVFVQLLVFSHCEETEVSTPSANTETTVSTLPEVTLPFQVEETTAQNENSSEPLSLNTLQHVAMLSRMILELIEPLSSNTDDSSVEMRNNTNSDEFFMSFIFDNRRRGLNRKMAVNNNFHADNLYPSQYFVENGMQSKQVPSPNIQVSSNQYPPRRRQPNILGLLQNGFGRMLPPQVRGYPRFIRRSDEEEQEEH